MEIFENYNAILKHLENLDDDTLMNAYNEYANEHHYENIYNNTDEYLDESFSCASEALKAIRQGSYNYNDNYVQLDGYGNPETTDHLTDFITLDELVEHVKENPDLYGVEFIDFNDLEDEELFNVLQENRCFEGVPNSDEYNSLLWDREQLETVLLDSDLID